MQTTQTVMASLLLAMVVSAQSDPPATARADLDRLTAEWKSAQDGYRAAMQAAQASDEYKAAVEAKDRKKMSELLGKVDDIGSLVERHEQASCAFGQQEPVRRGRR